MAHYTVSAVRNPETGTYKVIEPAGLEVEEASFDAMVEALPQALAAAYGPAAQASGIDVTVRIMPPAAGPTGTTGASGPTGTTGTTGTTGASGPTGA